ncbi:hypothetical protein VNO77_02995 [Canavalia gladiata]|uniref:Uncharacterized protein n=1 Tax=Canavalia gladiata TaxID=3824 RepID=A0AAN9MU32_CANGL
MDCEGLSSSGHEWNKDPSVLRDDYNNTGIATRKRMEIAAQCPPKEPDPFLFVSSRISLFSVGRRSKISFQRSPIRHSIIGILGKIPG